MQIIKKISIISMSCFYIYVGIKHFIDPNWFINIIPPYLPWHLELVYLSGLFEIILGLLLLIPKTRKLAAYGLIALLIAVYPANIYLAFNELPQKMMGISSFAASWIRLPIQFIFIGLAYWHSK
ncbi:MAG: DoxX family protein [Candidatus Marinimicrobia bacterium]|nr:DoxX family protein [Candidatus Neomarinimicrobiota bacterium]|tara:strand:- start:38032 stop:38403 length:372 start_codon:yes stop_codon:yes gene_type:complete